MLFLELIDDLLDNSTMSKDILRRFFSIIRCYNDDVEMVIREVI